LFAIRTLRIPANQDKHTHTEGYLTHKVLTTPQKSAPARTSAVRIAGSVRDRSEIPSRDGTGEECGRWEGQENRGISVT